MVMFTLNQFWSVYQAELVVDLFAAKFYSLIQNNIWLNECIYYTHKLRMQWRIQDFPEEGAPTPRGGGANSPGGGRQHTILPYFHQKLNEIERILRVLRAPLDPPLV